jgi:hypothetical protein
MDAIPEREKDGTVKRRTFHSHAGHLLALRINDVTILWIKRQKCAIFQNSIRAINRKVLSNPDGA